MSRTRTTAVSERKGHAFVQTSVTLLRSLNLELRLALFMFLALVAVAVFGKIVWPVDPYRVDVLGALAPPSWDHPMGTDNVGRDMVARFIEGAQISLFVATAVTVISLVLGSLLGILAGLFKGWIDAVISMVMDGILAFPPLIFAIAVALALGAGTVSAIIGTTIAVIPFYVRLVRSEALKIREVAYIEAAVAAGIPNSQIIVRHIVPQLYGTLLVQASSVFGFSIITLAGLGFVGLGPQPPVAEWGNMITEALPYALTGQWWMGVFPGIGILIATLSTGMISDQLRVFYDPRAKRG